MSPQNECLATHSGSNECVATVKEMMADAMRETNALVGRLNAMHAQIEEEEEPVTKVRRKVAWAAERDHSVEALSKIVASLQRALGEEERNTHGRSGSSASRRTSSAGWSPAGAVTRSRYFSTSSTSTSLDELGRNSATSLAGLDAPRTWKGYRSSTAPPLALAAWPHRRLPPGSPLAEAAPSPSSLSRMLRRISSEASLFPQQVRRSLKKSACSFANVQWFRGGFSASVLRRVGWNPSEDPRPHAWSM